eukprot:g5362.t1
MSSSSRRGRRMSVSKKPQKSNANTKAVVGLINALHSQRKFKRLCIYSLQAMVKQVCPPNTTWQDSVEDLVGARGIRILKDLLNRYGDDEVILTCVTKILSQMPKHTFLGKQFAKKLIEEGAILDTLTAMEKNPNVKDEALRNGLEVVEKCATVNARSMGTKEVCAAIENVQKHHKKDKKVHNACARTFEKIVRSRAAAKVFVACDQIEYTFDAMAMPASNLASVTSQIRTLNRLAVRKENIARIEKCDGLRRTVAVLEAYPEATGLQRAGGRLINTVAGEYVEKIMSDLTKKDATLKEREYYAQLLASLSIKSKSAAKILKCGGVAEVMALLKDPSISPKMTSALMLILQRLSNINTALVAREIKKGGLDTILEMAKMYKDDPLVCATCISSLKALAMDSGTLKRLEELGGVEAVLSILLAHPDFKDAAAHGTAFVAQLVALDYPVEKLLKAGGVKACLLAIKSNANDPDVVTSALAALAAMAETGEEAASAIGRGGIVAAIESLAAFAGPNQPRGVKIGALRLLNALAGFQANRKDLVELGGVDAVVRAVYDAGRGDDEVRRVGEAILDAASDMNAVRRALAALEACANDKAAISKGDVATLKKMRGALMSLTIFAGVKSTSGEIAVGGGAASIARALSAVLEAGRATGKQTTRSEVDVACVVG